MTTEGRARPFGLTDSDRVRRIRDAFRTAGYTDGGVAQLLGDDLPPRLGAARVPALLRRTAGGTPLEILVRLFVLGVETAEAEVRRAVVPGPLEDWLAVGLLERTAGGVRASVQVRCFGAFLVASDFGRDQRGELHPDFVMAISPSTLALAGFTVRRPVEATLDLGSGAGLQAFLAAGHSRQVVAVDRNPRAVAMAELNAELNDLANVRVVEGDLFEPVGDQRFGLIVSNPPFVIAPAFRYYFLHSGLPGDEVCRRIVRTAPDLLEEGGFCQLAANWVVAPGEPWQAPVARWAEGTGCDVLVLSKAVESAESYAADWAEPLGTDPESLANAVEETLTGFEAAGIRGIASGLLTLRRRAGDNWFRADDLPPSMAFPCGDDVLRAFDVGDALARLADERVLLDHAYRLADDVRLVQQSQPGDGTWVPVEREVQRTDGLRWRGTIDEFGAQLMARCDGVVPLRQLVSELAASAGLDGEAVAAASLPIVRRLLEQGFLRTDLSGGPRSTP